VRESYLELFWCMGHTLSGCDNLEWVWSILLVWTINLEILRVILLFSCSVCCAKYLASYEVP